MMKDERKEQKRKEAFRKWARQHAKLRRNLRKHGGDILQSGNFKSTNSFIQHGSVSVHSHSIRVAECFHHPNVALENASREYQLTPRERDIIRKHMWPLTLFHIPRCREAWVVTTADKYCSLKETLLERKGRNKNRKKSENNDA